MTESSGDSAATPTPGQDGGPPKNSGGRGRKRRRGNDRRRRRRANEKNAPQQAAEPAERRKRDRRRRSSRRQGARRPASNNKGKASNETSAGGVVFRRTDRGALFLLIRDSYHNWGFPKGHIEPGESSEAAALREVEEETGLEKLEPRGKIESIDWYFRFRGKLIYKVCDFYLMESLVSKTKPQRDEGITACRWLPIGKARAMISYANAREVLERAEKMVGAILTDASSKETTGGPA